MTLLPTMKMRLSAPATVIDIGRLEDLKGICVDGDAVIIGALTTHAEVAESEILRAAIPGLAELASHIGDAQVRNRGTLGPHTTYWTSSYCVGCISKSLSVLYHTLLFCAVLVPPAAHWQTTNHPFTPSWEVCLVVDSGSHIQSHHY